MNGTSVLAIAIIALYDGFTLRFCYGDVVERSITIVGKNAPVGVAGLINPGA